jgi:hypothetical protein
MLVWDWVWGIQHWQKSLSPALSQSLCGVHSSIISNTLEYTTDDKSGQESRLTFKRSTIASPETSKLIGCHHSHATVLPSQAYSPFIVAKLHVNGKANCTLAQRHQRDNSICPTSSDELKPIQATQTSDYSHHFPSITEVLYHVSRNQMSLSLPAVYNSSSGYSSAINLRNRTESALTEHTQTPST